MISFKNGSNDILHELVKLLTAGRLNQYNFNILVNYYIIINPDKTVEMMQKFGTT